MPTVPFARIAVILVTLLSELCVIVLSMRRLSYLKPLLLSLSLMSLPVSAAETSPELIKAWTEQASDLHARLSALSGNSVPDIMRLEISRFGRISGRISKSGSADAPFPTDLACIFRGMEEEAENQLDAISHASSAEDVSKAKKRLLSMFEDAEIVGEAATIAIAGSNYDLRPVAASGACQEIN